MSKTIVCVDDDEQVLRALRRLMRQTDYSCYFFSNGAEALEYMSENLIDLVITDIRMPKMDGFELLRQIKLRHPRVLRMALSGYSDSQQVLKAIDDNLAKLYLFKPWDNEEFLSTIGSLFALEDRLAQYSVLTLVNTFGEIPTLPDVYSTINALIQQDVDVSKIASKLEEDPALVGRILRVANTAYYKSHTGSMSQAIMMMGLFNIQNMVLSHAVFNAAETLKYMAPVWKHANYTNKLVQSLYVFVKGQRMPQYLSTVGLLHSIGIPFMAQCARIKFETLAGERLKDSSFSLEALEREAFGITHQELGSFLLNWWGLPHEIIETALYARGVKNFEVDSYMACSNPTLVAIVHVSSYFVWRQINHLVFNHELEVPFIAIIEQASGKTFYDIELFCKAMLLEEFQNEGQ